MMNKRESISGSHNESMIVMLRPSQKNISPRVLSQIYRSRAGFKIMRCGREIFYENCMPKTNFQNISAVFKKILF